MRNLYDKLRSEQAIKWYKIAVVVALSVLLVSLVALKTALPVGEDLPRQMASGREIIHGVFTTLHHNVFSYTEPNHYFANHHWLFGVLAYLLYASVGWTGMYVFKILLILGTFLILFRAARLKANFWLVALCAVPTIMMLSMRSSFRPELFGYFFVALYVYILFRSEQNQRSNLMYWLIPTQLLWANLHITFPIGVMIVGGFLLEKVVLGFKHVRTDRYICKLLIVFGLLIAVSFINPNGIKGVIYSLSINADTSGAVVSAEVQPIFAPNNDTPINDFYPATLFVWVLGITLASFGFGFRKKPIFLLLGVIGAAGLSFFMIRGYPFVALFFLVAAPANFTTVCLRGGVLLQKYWNKGTLCLIFTLALIIIVGYKMVRFYERPAIGAEYGVGITKYSPSAARFFLDNQLHGPILNDTDIGSYLTWYFYPQEKVFVDNRFGDAYSSLFLSRYNDIFIDEVAWREALEKYNFNAIFLYQYDGGGNIRDFIYRRIGDPGWALVYVDRYSVILLRNVPENKSLIEKYRITTDNVNERLGALTKSFDPDDLVTSADLFGLMGQASWSQAASTLAVAQRPYWGKLWYAMGQTELIRTDTANADASRALLYLQQAINHQWQTPNSYSYLALAYYRLGQISQAKTAVEKERKLNPKSNDVQLWLARFAKDAVNPVQSHP